MKIIRTLRPELIVHFRNVFFCFLCSMLVVFSNSCSHSKLYERKVYDNPDSVIDTLCENQEDFEKVMATLSREDLRKYIIEEEGDGSWYNRTLVALGKANLISKEEYEFVVDFFKQFGPWCLSRGNHFQFFVEDACVLLYYLPSGDTRDILNNDQEVFHIKDNWYYVVHDR